MKYLLILIALISCTPETSCELGWWGYLNVKNRTSTPIKVELAGVVYDIAALDSVTVFEVPEGLCLLKGFDVDTFYFTVEITACQVKGVDIKYLNSTK